MSSNNVLASNEDSLMYGSVDFQNQVNMDNISWNEPVQQNNNNRGLMNANEVITHINNAANRVNNAQELTMFQGCVEDPIAGESMCFLSNPEPINYRYNNTDKQWANVMGDKVIVSGYDQNNKVESSSSDISRRGLEYLKTSNDQLLVQPLCDVYDCANKPANDPNCSVLNCLKCKNA
jgi:hypothetical protein